MKTIAYVAALVVLGATSPAFADSHAEKADAQTEADAEAAPALTIESSIETLMANEQGAAILEKHLPGIGSHSAYDQFKGMSLVQLQPWSGGMITDEIIAAVKSDLEALA